MAIISMAAPAALMNRDSLSYEWEDGPSGIDVIWAQGGANEGIVRDTFGDQDDFHEFEIIKGSDQRDMFVGNDGNNQVEGNAGFDIFAGGAGSDTFRYKNERGSPRRGEQSESSSISRSR